MQDKNDINILKKQNEELSTKFKNLMKECETLKNENSSYVVQINELKDQVKIIFLLNLPLSQVK